uniref:Uncharacterized protein n=1 Tax=Steinernema glaseri TaxID=37863 RepID=A0A1I7XVQ0_9BILA
MDAGQQNNKKTTEAMQPRRTRTWRETAVYSRDVKFTNPKPFFKHFFSTIELISFFHVDRFTGTEQQTKTIRKDAEQILVEKRFRVAATFPSRLRHRRRAIKNNKKTTEATQPRSTKTQRETAVYSAKVCLCQRRQFVVGPLTWKYGFLVLPVPSSFAVLLRHSSKSAL